MIVPAAYTTGWRAQAAALGLTVLALVILWLALADPLIGFYQSRAATLEKKREVAARMEAIATTLPALKARPLSAAPAAPPSLAVTGVSDAVASANLQALIGQLATQSGASVASTEAAPVAGARRIGTSVQLGGRYEAIVKLLQRINGVTPRLGVDRLDLQSLPGRTANDPPAIDARLTIYVVPAEAPL